MKIYVFQVIIVSSIKLQYISRTNKIVDIYLFSGNGIKLIHSVFELSTGFAQVQKV